MIADTLRCSPVEADGLAALVHGRSEGNPFFVRTYLQSLHEQNVLTFDRERGVWTWDLARVEQAVFVHIVWEDAVNGGQLCGGGQGDQLELPVSEVFY